MKVRLLLWRDGGVILSCSSANISRIPASVSFSCWRSDCDGWLDASGSAPPSHPQKDGGPSQPEEEPAACCEQRSITETVTNGSMKETVSLTVDAKTETAVFKRLDTHTSSRCPP